MTFRTADLVVLDRILSRAWAVVPMEDVFDGEVSPTVIGMRHDCDNIIVPAAELAQWEEDRGYRSTYYVLHSSPYWSDEQLLRGALEIIVDCGHEIGIHNDALTVALETGRDPADVLHEAIDELRSYGHDIRSTVAHGHHLCGVAHYVNDEMFSGCARPLYGAPDRTLTHHGRTVRIDPRPLSEFGLDFDANWIGRGDYLSDSGGRWSQPLEDVAAVWPAKGQLHILQHPDWWGQALEPSKAAA